MTLLTKARNAKQGKMPESERALLSQYTAVNTTPLLSTDKTNSKHPEIPGGVFAVSGDHA